MLLDFSCVKIDWVLGKLDGSIMGAEFCCMAVPAEWQLRVEFGSMRF